MDNDEHVFRILPSVLAAPLLVLGLSVALAGCQKVQADADTEEPTTQTSDESDNLCVEYESCDACIRGEVREGLSEGEAETVCGLAATGCWTTWDKPVTCSGQAMERSPS